MVGAALVGALALAPLVRRTTGALLVTALVGALAVAALRHHRALAVIVGTVAVAASSLWWGVGAATRDGLPTPTTLRQLRRSLQEARPDLLAFHVPLAHTAGVVVLATLVAGLAAVAGRAAGTADPALSLLPAGGLVLWSAVVRPSTGAAVVGLALGACVFLVLFAERLMVHRAFVVLAAVSLGTAALTLGWVAADAGSGTVSPGGPTVPAVAPSALSLTSDLTGLEIRDADVVLFRATSPVPSYWQVATLDTFTGTRWVPGPATGSTPPATGSTPPATTPSPGQRRLFTARVTLAAYSGQLLPAPPSTVDAAGSGSPVVTPSGLQVTAALAPGDHYSVTAVVPTTVADEPASTAAPIADTRLGPVPAVVDALAASITGAYSTPLDKAEALTDFFRSGRFQYTVTPPPLPAHTDPIVAFLTSSRRGSCEQFAGAFAVLARAAGLPTRVAVGFTPGRLVDGVTVVHGADAHAWPQVLIDGTWVSFEPTPQLPSGEVSPPGVLGPAGLRRPTAPTPPKTPPVSVTLPPQPATTVPPVPITTGGHHHPTAPSGPWWLLVAIIVAAVAGVILFVGRLRRRTPFDRVLRSWRGIDRALARQGVPRPPNRTPVAQRRALESAVGDQQGLAALRDLGEVAYMLEGVTFGSAEVTVDEARRAEQASHRARRAIASGVLSGSG